METIPIMFPREFTKEDLWKEDGELWALMLEEARKITRNVNKSWELREEARYRIAIYGPESFNKAYVVKIMKNCWRSVIKSRKREKDLLEKFRSYLEQQPCRTPGNLVLDHYKAAVLLIRALPVVPGRALRYRYLDHKSIAETASALGISRANVKKQCYIGCKIVRELLVLCGRFS